MESVPDFPRTVDLPNHRLEPSLLHAHVEQLSRDDDLLLFLVRRGAKLDEVDAGGNAVAAAVAAVPGDAVLTCYLVLGRELPDLTSQLVVDR